MLKQFSFFSRQFIKVLVFTAWLNPTFLNALNTHALTVPEQLSAFSKQTCTTSLVKKSVAFKNYSLRSLLSSVQKLVVRHPFITSGIIATLAATLALGTLWYFKKTCAPPALPLNIKTSDSNTNKENPVDLKKIVRTISFVVPTVITAKPATLPRESNACWLASTIQLIYNIPEVKDGLIKNASSDFGKKTATLLKTMETIKSVKELKPLYGPVYESACKEFNVTQGSFSRVDNPVDSLIIESAAGALFDFDFNFESKNIIAMILGTKFFTPYTSQKIVFSWNNAVNYFSLKEPFKLLNIKKIPLYFFCDVEITYASNPPGKLNLPLALPLADKSYELIGFIASVCTFNNNNSQWKGSHFKTYVKDQYDPQHPWYICDDMAQNITKIAVKDITTWPQEGTYPKMLIYRQITDPLPDFAKVLDQI